MKYLGLKTVVAAALIVNLCGLAAAEESATSSKEVVAAASRVVPTGPAVEINKIEIWVGNEIITTKEIEAPLQQYREHFALKYRGAELDEKMKETRELHIQRLIESKLLLLEARAQDYELGDAVVEEEVDKEMEKLQAQFPSRKAFQEELAKEQMTEWEFRKEREKMVRETMIRQRLLQAKVQEFKTGAEVSDAQLKKYYEENKSKFTRPSRAHLEQIFVGLPDTGMKTDEFKNRYRQARQKIVQALQELNHGKSFEAVARAYSEHKATAEKGGDIGWIEEGNTGLPEFERVAFQQLKVGEHSKAVETARGFFIIKLIDKQQGGQLPFEEVKGRIRKEVMAEGSEKRYQAWLDTLKEKYKVRYATHTS